MQFDAKGNWTAIPPKKKRGLTIQEKIDAIRSRTDIFNVIHIQKPTKIEIENMKPPDMRKIINNTMLKKLEKQKYAVVDYAGMQEGLNVDEDIQE